MRASAIALDQALEAGLPDTERASVVAQWEAAPEEWELRRPTAWTPGDGIAIERYAQLIRDPSRRALTFNELRFLAMADRFGVLNGPDLVVIPRSSAAYRYGYITVAGQRFDYMLDKK